MSPMLFDLTTDEGEVVNVAPENPEKHRALYNAMKSYFSEVGARIPKINPDYDPAAYQSDDSYDIRQEVGSFQGTASAGRRRGNPDRFEMSSSRLTAMPVTCRFKSVLNRTCSILKLDYGIIAVAVSE